MLQTVGGKVFGGAAFGQVVMSQRAGPHYLSAVAVVFRVLHHFQGTVLHGLEQCLGNGIGQRHVLLGREITLHGVHHDVGGTGSRLIRRQRERALGIQNGKLATAQVAVEAALVLVFIACDDARVAHL